MTVKWRTIVKARIKLGLISLVNDFLEFIGDLIFIVVAPFYKKPGEPWIVAKLLAALDRKLIDYIEYVEALELEYFRHVKVIERSEEMRNEIIEDPF